MPVRVMFVTDLLIAGGIERNLTLLASRLNPDRFDRRIICLYGEKAHRELEEVSIRQSLANLRTFPFVAEREKNGTLKLLGCHFSIRDGELWLLDEAEDKFRPV